MTKTAAFILNHNLPEYTDMLFESLRPYAREDYDLFVLDNGSHIDGTSKYTSFRLTENVYFGGGFNAGMQHVLENEEYDSMLFLNNDLTVHPYNFVKGLRNAMCDDHHNIMLYDVVSPCFYNIEPLGQCHWKTMHNWGATTPREVSFIDFQCPLISKRLLKEVGEIDADLIYGWGVDALFALTAKRLGYKMAVLDSLCVLHHNSMTVKKGVAGMDIPTYCRRAEDGQHRFFQKNNLLEQYQQLRKRAEAYEYI